MRMAKSHRRMASPKKLQGQHLAKIIASGMLTPRPVTLDSVTGLGCDHVSKGGPLWSFQPVVSVQFSGRGFLGLSQKWHICS